MTRHSPALAILFVSLGLAIPAAARQNSPSRSAAVLLAAKLEQNLRHVATSLDGVMGVYAENLRTGQTFHLNADRVFPTASSIKIPIIITLMRQDQLGKLNLNDRVTIRRAMLVGGSGVLQDFGDGTSSIALRDLAVLMVVLSDNSATNILIDRIGMANVNAEIHRAGLLHTRLARKMMDIAAERASRENVSTPREMATILAKLERGQLLDAVHTASALHLLEDYKQTPLRAAIPPNIRVADKPGSLPGVRCDSGVVLVPGAPYVLSVMTTYDAKGRAADRAITDVSRAVFSYFDRLANSNAYGNRVR